MTAAYDPDDPHLAERIAEEYVHHVQGIERVRAEALDAVREIRANLVAVAAARRIGEPDGPALDALHSYVDGLNREVLSQALYDVVWNGGEAVEDEVQRYLTKLRDMWNVDPVLDVINRTPRRRS